MVDYEKGSPAWDIGMILTRHGDGKTRNEAGGLWPCNRYESIHRTNTLDNPGISPMKRLVLALATPCNCGAGDSDAERSSLIAAEKKAAEKEATSDDITDAADNGG